MMMMKFEEEGNVQKTIVNNFWLKFYNVILDKQLINHYYNQNGKKLVVLYLNDTFFNTSIQMFLLLKYN